MRRLDRILLITNVITGVRLAAAQDDNLHVLRHIPDDSARSSSVVRIIFDRPVAGRLDATIPAERVLRVEPAIAGRASWRDPITLEFVPTAPLAPESHYAVTVSNDFRAIDGSRLASPYRFEFLVPGPRLLQPSSGSHSTQLPPDGKLLLLYSAPVDLDRLRHGARLELIACGGGPVNIAMRPVRERPVIKSDPYPIQDFGGWDNDTVAEVYRRVVELEPVAPPPEGCAGNLVLPTTAEDARFGTEERYPVTTVAPFLLTSFGCANRSRCPMDHLELQFSALVKREELLRHLRFVPARPVELEARWGRQPEGDHWHLAMHLAPRSEYRLVIDSALRDVLGRPFKGAFDLPYSTSDYEPDLGYARGSVIVPRSGAHSLPVRHVNVRAARMLVYRIPERARARIFARSAYGSIGRKELDSLAGAPEMSFVSLPGQLNVPATTEVALPSIGSGGLIALQFVADTVLSTEAPNGRPAPAELPPVHARMFSRMDFAFIQLSDLALTTKAGPDGRIALVTSLADGRPQAGVRVIYRDTSGVVSALGTTDSTGAAMLVPVALPFSAPSPRPAPKARPYWSPGWTFPHVESLEAQSGDDRIVMSLANRVIGYEMDDLHPARLSGRMSDVPPAAAALFADRGIYRPGEMLYLKGIVRRGRLGELAPAVHERVHLEITLADDDGFTPGHKSAEILDTVLVTSGFGTVDDSLRLRTGLLLGRYDVDLQVGGDGDWTTVARDSIQIAEYRAPEFLVHATTDTAPKYGGDTVRIATEGRFLFGAPMAHAPALWRAELRELSPWEIRIPGAEGWEVGEWIWRPEQSAGDRDVPTLRGGVPLDASGRATLEVPLAGLRPGRPGELTVHVAVIDVNHQVVSANVAVPVHPARIYVLARRAEHSWFWSVGKDASLDVRVVRPDGVAVRGVPVTVMVKRRSLFAGVPDSVIRTDTVGGGEPGARVVFQPPEGGLYEVHLAAADERGDSARTTVSGFAFGGSNWWGREAEHLALAASARTAAIGDTLSIAFDSPFDSADAWVTVEREGILAQFRRVVPRGANRIPVPIGATFVPNAFIGVVLLRRDGTRGRPDSAAQLIRAGYAEVAVSDSGRRLSVMIEPDPAPARPGTSARFSVRVRDRSGAGVRSEVTLWAVDEGVLSLTGYQMPDIVAQIYAPRALGARLWSTLANALTNDPGLRLELRASPIMLQQVVVTGAGVAYSGEGPEPLRSDFRSTAFYLPAVRTDAEGNATVSAALPDNITTYRIMAAAVDATDRLGSGETTLLATKEIVARPSLTRFVRPGDSLFAGTAVNARDGKVRPATVRIATSGLHVVGPTQRTISLAAGVGAEARFHLVAPSREHAESAAVAVFDVSAAPGSDRVESRIPVRPDYVLRTHTRMGVLRGETVVRLELPAGIDLVRSRLRIRIGSSPLSPMFESFERLQAYPYDCSEQIASVGRALIAIARAARSRGVEPPGGDPRARLQGFADALVRRQRWDGSFGYWSDQNWTSPWLSAHAGLFLLEAKAEGVSVDSTVFANAVRYLDQTLTGAAPVGGKNRYEQRARRLALGNRVAVVDFLRRYGTPNVRAEDSLLALAPFMTWEDRLRVAEVLSSRTDAREAARQLVATAWRSVSVVGGRVDLPDSIYAEREFPSHVAPAAALLRATVSLRLEEPRLGGLIETVLSMGRAERRWAWNTQDYAAAIAALAEVSGAIAPADTVRASANGLSWPLTGEAAAGDSASPYSLAAVSERDARGRPLLVMRLRATDSASMRFFALSIDEVPVVAPVTPDASGMLVERWYERLSDCRRVVSLKAGELVRVRLRVTVPADRMFVALEDPLPAGLEVVDLSLHTSSTLQPFVELDAPESKVFLESGRPERGPHWQSWLYGSWEGGWWSPWEHRTVHDDRVVWFARMLWRGSYDASYIARATTAGDFVRPPAHAEEMYDPAVHGRSDGGRFAIVTPRTE